MCGGAAAGLHAGAAGAEFFQNRDPIAHVTEDFQRTFEVSEEITWRKCRNTSLFQRLFRAALRVFSPLM